MGPGTPLVEDITDIDKYGGGRGGLGAFGIFFSKRISILRVVLLKNLGAVRCTSHKRGAVSTASRGLCYADSMVDSLVIGCTVIPQHPRARETVLACLVQAAEVVPRAKSPSIGRKDQATDNAAHMSRACGLRPMSQTDPHRDS